MFYTCAVGHMTSWWFLRACVGLAFLHKAHSFGLPCSHIMQTCSTKCYFCAVCSPARLTLPPPTRGEFVTKQRRTVFLSEIYFLPGIIILSLTIRCYISSYFVTILALVFALYPSDPSCQCQANECHSELTAGKTDNWRLWAPFFLNYLNLVAGFQCTSCNTLPFTL